MVNWPTHNTNGHLTKFTAPNGRETEFAVNGQRVRTSRTDAMERTIMNGSETVTCRTGDESPACEHETHLRGFMAIPRRRDSHRMPADSSSGASVGARYYDAQVVRFITRDTVLSEHPYLYCEHDPVNAVDPSGRRSGSELWDDVREYVGGAIGGVTGGLIGRRASAIIGRRVGGAMGMYVGGTIGGPVGAANGGSVPGASKLGSVQQLPCADSLLTPGGNRDMMSHWNVFVSLSYHGTGTADVDRTDIQRHTA